MNDRILSANGVSFESIDYSSAVDIIKNAEHINMVSLALFKVSYSFLTERYALFFFCSQLVTESLIL